MDVSRLIAVLRHVTAAVALSASFAACASSPVAQTGKRHLRVVNATYEDLIAMSFAPVDGTEFHAAAMSGPLAGGRASMVVDVPAGACLRDVRVAFKDGRSWVYPKLDVCRGDGLQLATGPSGGVALMPEHLQVAGRP